MRIVDDLRGHILFSSTVSLGSSSTDRSSKPKVRNFVADFLCVLSLDCPFGEKHVLGLNIAMYKVSLVNALEPFDHLDDDSERLFEGECLARQLGLIGKEVTHIAVLHDDDNEIGC